MECSRRQRVVPARLKLGELMFSILPGQFLVAWDGRFRNGHRFRYIMQERLPTRWLEGSVSVSLQALQHWETRLGNALSFGV
jgi:hypothetical protein